MEPQRMQKDFVKTPGDSSSQAFTEKIISSAMEVHSQLGPGLLERVYKEALCWELVQRGLRVERQIDVPIVYKGQTLAAPLRLDIRIEKLVIVEVKATTAYNTVFEAQALTYLRLLDLRLALVKDGIHRVVNKL